MNESTMPLRQWLYRESVGAFLIGAGAGLILAIPAFFLLS
jgi:hypothetical protein